MKYHLEIEIIDNKELNEIAGAKDNKRYYILFNDENNAIGGHVNGDSIADVFRELSVSLAIIHKKRNAEFVSLN